MAQLAETEAHQSCISGPRLSVQVDKNARPLAVRVSSAAEAGAHRKASARDGLTCVEVWAVEVTVQRLAVELP